jgi:hypothetical protein
MPIQIWFDIDDTLFATLTSLNGATIYAKSPLPDGDVVEGIATIRTQIDEQQNKGSLDVVFDVLEPQGCTMIKICLTKDQISNIKESNNARSRYIYSGSLIAPNIQ